MLKAVAFAKQIYKNALYLKILIEIMIAIEEFIDSRNQKLYNEVLKKTNINYIEDIKWRCNTNSEIPEIHYRLESNYPVEYFTHELLHIKYFYKGLICPKHNEKNNFNKYVVDLFNQLCHQKFYDEFCALGFKPERFLDESYDTEAMNTFGKTIDRLENEFSKNRKLNDLFDLCHIYLSLKSPHDNSLQKDSYIRRLKRIKEENFFTTFDAILEDWKKDQSFNASLTLARIFSICNYPIIGFSIHPSDTVLFARDVTV